MHTYKAWPWSSFLPGWGTGPLRKGFVGSRMSVGPDWPDDRTATYCDLGAKNDAWCYDKDDMVIVT